MLLQGLIMGLCGTLLLDAWGYLLEKAGIADRPNWARVGRWVSQLGTRVFHDDIGDAPPHRNELAIGWAFHYGVGLAFGLIFALLVGPAWFAQPTFPVLWLYALVTIVGGWFLLQPGMGLGWALGRTPRPWKGRALGLIGHTVFGAGMYLPVVLV